MKINTIFNTHMLYWLPSLVYTGRKFSKTNTFAFSFLLFSYYCRGELIETSLSLNYFASTRIQKQKKKVLVT